jgi:hypothetical protein
MTTKEKAFMSELKALLEKYEVTFDDARAFSWAWRRSVTTGSAP